MTTLRQTPRELQQMHLATVKAVLGTEKGDSHGGTDRSARPLTSGRATIDSVGTLLYVHTVFNFRFDRRLNLGV